MYKHKFTKLLTAALLAGTLGLSSCSAPTASTATKSDNTTGSGAAAEKTTAAQAATPTKLTFVLDWTPNTNHTGLYVAQKMNYYAEAGLDVDIQQPPNGDAVPLVAGGKAELGISFQDSIAPAYTGAEPLPVTSIAAIVNHNTSGILSLKKNGISSPKGLEGMRYATWDLPVEKAVLQNVCEKDGGDFAKIKLIPSTVTNAATALQTDVDAVWVFYAWDGIAAELSGLELNYWNFRDINPVFDYYSPTIIANDKWLKEQPQQAKAFMAATAKGYKYAMEHPEEAAKILCEAAPGLDIKLVTASQKWLATQYQGDAAAWGHIDATRWNAFYKWLWENKLIEKAIPEGHGFSNEYLPA